MSEVQNRIAEGLAAPNLSPPGAYPRQAGALLTAAMDLINASGGNADDPKEFVRMADGRKRPDAADKMAQIESR